MTTIVRAADAADFLALVPRLAGYRPSRSIALVPFHGSRTLGVMRVDLPGPDAAGDSFAATLIGMLCKLPEASGVAFIVYTDAPFADADSITSATLVAALRTKADACGIDVVDALCVAADGWGSYLDPDCPAAGRPLRELDRPGLLDGLDHELGAPASDQAAGAELPAADLAQTERTAHALQSLDDALEAVQAATARHGGRRGDLAALDPQALAAACALDDVPALFEDALEWDPTSLRPFDAAALIWCLNLPALRDVALMQWCAPATAAVHRGDQLLQAQLAWSAGEEYPEALALPMAGEGPRPDADRLLAALALLRHAAALSPRTERCGPLAAAAWVAWALGRGTHAGHYAGCALELDADHGLAGIVAALVAAGQLPEWAFVRPAA